MPIASPAQDALNATGIDQIADWIHDGASQSEIARKLGVDTASLNRWIHADPQRSARARLAMADSAEAWVDRGHQYLLEAVSDNAEIQRARALEQHCARRAAIRNPRYRDNVDVQHSGSVDVAVRSITRRVIDAQLVEQVQPALADQSSGQGPQELPGTSDTER